MLCKNCDNKIKDAVKFCVKCGSEVEIMNEREIEIKRLVAVLKLVILEKESEQKNTKETNSYKSNALILLKKFEEHLKNEQEIPKALPEEPEFFLSFKDILSIFFCGVIITAVITPISGVEATFWNLLECAAFFWTIIGYFTYHKRKKEYDELKKQTHKKIEKMSRGEGISKYKNEDSILGIINKNYKLYIGTPIFHTVTIRNQNKSAFQTEIEDIIKFAEENKMDSMRLSDIIEKFYQSKHNSKAAKLYNDIEKLKDRAFKLKSELEALEMKTEIDSVLETVRKFLDTTTPNDVSISLEEYNTTIKKVSSKIEYIEQEREKEEKAREKAIESLMNNIPVYEKKLVEIAEKRAKYPDNQLSSFFIKKFDSKMNEFSDNLKKASLGNIKNKSIEIESELKNSIAYLNDMIETEFEARHKRIYGKPENKLAVKFKSIYK